MGTAEIMKDAIGYSRLSIKDQSRYSLKDQERRITEYCAANNLNLLQIFTDNGKSSYTFDRPDWKSLEAFIKKNKTVSYLIIVDYDRFSRNLAEALLKINELQSKWGIKIVPVGDQLDIDQADPSNYLMRAFKLMMAESELMNIRKRVKAGKLQAAKMGFWTTTAPYGYRNKRTSDGKPSLEIDPEKAKIVRRIFDLTAQGYSPVEVRKAIPEFKMKGNSAIRWMLENPVYIGMVKVPAFKEAPEYYTKGAHKAIITEELFNLVQGKGTPKGPNKSEEVPLRGVLKCWCGREVTAGNSKSKNGNYYWYYLCGEHRVNMSAVKLHKQLNEVLSKLTFSDTDVDYLRNKISYKIAAMMQSRGEDIEQVKKDLAAIKSKISSTEEKYLSNTDISPDTFRKVITEMKNKKGELKKKLNALTATSNDYIAQLEFMLPKLRDLSAAYEAMPLEKKQRFLKVIFGEDLNWSNGSYRTPFLHPLFAHNTLDMKEKKLLIVEQPVIKMGKNTASSPDKNRTCI